MEPIYREQFTITDQDADRFGRAKSAALLWYAQQVAGEHCRTLDLDWQTLQSRRMFWAVIRQRVQVSRIPTLGQTITVETWPMPTTRVAYPRSTVAYDGQGRELFRSIGLWVLMDLDKRAMILPPKSGIIVRGTVRGTELPAPGALMLRGLQNTAQRTVRFSELDRNGHMNNTRYMDWVDDLLGSDFHRDNVLREFTVCYLSEAREGETLRVDYSLDGSGLMQVEAHRDAAPGEKSVVFSAQALYGPAGEEEYAL